MSYESPATDYHETDFGVEMPPINGIYVPPSDIERIDLTTQEKMRQRNYSRSLETDFLETDFLRTLGHGVLESVRAS